ncbi:MAG: single-stranded DNA-binding protein [Fimbriimonadales bacterium]|nr:MAG: single-stranded DNA-binding protein [Fimbriimonadales bacterium]
MKEGAEGSGRTLEEARQNAAAALGLSVDECDFEILEERAGGLFSRAKFVVRAVPKAVEKGEAQPAQEEAPTEAQPITATEEDGERARALVEEMLAQAGFEVEVTVESLTGKYVNLKLQGPDEELIQQKKGAVLDAIQFLGNALYSHGRQESARLTVDVGAYRSKRQQVLEKLARDIAALVIEKQEEAVLDPLPAHERRIIHNALKDMEGVETYSEGEEPQRYVVIAPKS